jgi:hypothetical protein
MFILHFKLTFSIWLPARDRHGQGGNFEKDYSGDPNGGKQNFDRGESRQG